jgi:hypothetical protein
VVRIGNWKRNISLPIGLARLDISAARYEGDFLNIYFAIQADAPPAEEELKPTRWQTLRARLSGR